MTDSQFLQYILDSKVFQSWEKFKQNITKKLTNVQKLKPYYDQAERYGIEYIKQNPNILQSEILLIQDILNDIKKNEIDAIWKMECE